MKLIVVTILALFALANAAPVEEPAKIIRSDYEQKPEGGYNFEFETENGINRSEKGEIKDAVDEDNKTRQVVVVKGTYSYIDNEGVLQTITYEADEHGFRAEGNSIPKPVSRR